MSVSKAYAPWSVVLDAETAQAGTAKYVDAIQDLTVDEGLQTGLIGGSGQPYNSMGFLRSGNPVGSFTSTDLKTCLDEIGIISMKIDNGINGDGVDLYFQRYAQGADRAGGATAHHTEIGDGIIIPTGISMADEGDATYSAQIIATSSDGLTHPFVFDETATLPTAYPDSKEAWTLGKVDFNGTTVEGISAVDIQTGVALIGPFKRDGNLFPTFVAIRLSQPIITLQTEHIDVTSFLTEQGLGYAASTIVIYARKRAEGAGFVSDGTAQHISFTMGISRADGGAVSGDQASKIVTITPWDTPGASPVRPLTVNTATTIS